MEKALYKWTTLLFFYFYPHVVSNGKVLVGRKEMVLASLDGKSKGRACIFPATALQIPALWPSRAGELSGSDPRAGSFWPEPEN